MMCRYRININRELCVGDGLCQETAPDTFLIDQDGKSTILDADGDLPEYILEAAENCRLRAITLFDADTGQRVWPRC